MRPRTIVWFERTYLASVSLAYAVMFREWRDLVVAWGDWQFFVLMLLLTLIIPIALALLVSRRRSRAALAVLLLITWLIGAAFISVSYPSAFASLGDIAVLTAEVVAMAASLLPFTPSARAWLAAPREAPQSAEALGRTFE